MRLKEGLFILAIVRFSLKDLERAYSKTEDDIKAVQSVGQIIGEVMKQLDDERCTSHSISTGRKSSHSAINSYCESVVGTALCCVVQTDSPCGKAQGWDTSVARYDNTNRHADIASGG